MFGRRVWFRFQKDNLFLCFIMQSGISVRSTAGNTEKNHKISLTKRRFEDPAVHEALPPGRTCGEGARRCDSSQYNGKALGRLAQKSPRTCRVSASLEPFQSVDHGAPIRSSARCELVIHVVAERTPLITDSTGTVSN
jgi:hypothetical protein